MGEDNEDIRKGHLFIGITDANGLKFPSLVDRKSFGQVKDVTSDFLTGAREAINQLARNAIEAVTTKPLKTKEDIKAANDAFFADSINALEEYFFRVSNTRRRNDREFWFNIDGRSVLVIQKAKKDSNGKVEKNEKQNAIREEVATINLLQDEAIVLQQVQEAFEKADIPFNIDIKRIGDKQYDELLRTSGVLFTDLVSADIMDINYTFNPVRQLEDGSWEMVDTGKGYVKPDVTPVNAPTSIVSQPSVQGETIPGSEKIVKEKKKKEKSKKEARKKKDSNKTVKTDTVAQPVTQTELNKIEEGLEIFKEKGLEAFQEFDKTMREFVFNGDEGSFNIVYDLLLPEETKKIIKKELQNQFNDVSLYDFLTEYYAGNYTGNENLEVVKFADSFKVKMDN